MCVCGPGQGVGVDLRIEKRLQGSLCSTRRSLSSSMKTFVKNAWFASDRPIGAAHVQVASGRSWECRSRTRCDLARCATGGCRPRDRLRHGTRAVLRFRVGMRLQPADSHSSSLDSHSRVVRFALWRQAGPDAQLSWAILRPGFLLLFAAGSLDRSSIIERTGSTRSQTRYALESSSARIGSP